MSREEQVKSFLDEVENGLDKERLRKNAPDIKSDDMITALFATIDYVTYFNAYQIRVLELAKERFPLPEDDSDLSFYKDLAGKIYDIEQPFDELVIQDLIKKYHSLRNNDLRYFYVYAIAYLGGDKAHEFIKQMRSIPTTEETTFHFDVALGILDPYFLVRRIGMLHESYTKPVFKTLDEITWIDKVLNTLTKLGAWNLEHGDKELALQFFDKATKVKPKDFKVWHNLAKSLMRVEMFDESEEMYQKALDLESRNPFLLNDYGILYFLQEEFTQALVHFHQAHEIAPENTLVLHSLGLVHLQLGNQQIAKGYFERILEFEPYNYEARKMLGMLQ